MANSDSERQKFQQRFKEQLARLKKHPKDVDLHIQAGFCAQKLGREGDARKLLERAVQLDPSKEYVLAKLRPASPAAAPQGFATPRPRNAGRRTRTKPPWALMAGGVVGIAVIAGLILVFSGSSEPTKGGPKTAKSGGSKVSLAAEPSKGKKRNLREPKERPKPKETGTKKKPIELIIKGRSFKSSMGPEEKEKTWFAQPISQKPRQILKEFRCEERATKDRKRANGIGRGSILYEIRLWGTPLQLALAFKLAYTAPGTDDELYALLLLRRRIYDGQRTLARYVPLVRQKYHIDIPDYRTAQPRAAFVAAGRYIEDFDAVITAIESRVLVHVKKARLSERTAKLAVQPPETGFSDRLIEALRGGDKKVLSLVKREAAITALEVLPQGLSRAMRLLKDVKEKRLPDRLADKADDLLKAATAKKNPLTEKEIQQLKGLLSRTSPKRRLHALFRGDYASGAGSEKLGREYLAELNKKYSKMFSSRERLTLAVRNTKDLHGGWSMQAAELQAKWKDKVSTKEHVALIKEAVRIFYQDLKLHKSWGPIGSQIFFRTFVRENFARLPEKAAVRLFREQKNLDFAKLVIGHYKYAKDGPQEAFTAALRAMRYNAPLAAYIVQVKQIDTQSQVTMAISKITGKSFEVLADLDKYRAYLRKWREEAESRKAP